MTPACCMPGGCRWYERYSSLDPPMWGSCQQLQHATPILACAFKSEASGCEGAPKCDWDEEQGTCIISNIDLYRALSLGGGFGDAYDKAAGECRSVSGDAQACEAKETLGLDEGRYDQFRRYMLAILQASSDADALAQVGISAGGGPVSQVTLGPAGNATSANVSSLSAALGGGGGGR